MSKRAHAKSNGGIEDLEGSSRHKRRREVHTLPSDTEIMRESKAGAGVVLSKAAVREMGLKIWQTVKDAVKDGRQLAVPFLVKPSKQDYPDYYVFIQTPIALDDIKKHLTKGKYSSPEDVKKDFELLFANAKQYNRPDSTIFEDAEHLLTLVHKTYHKFVPEQADDDESPDLCELLEERLDKLISKSNSTDGRLLSTEFMQLPSKKLWPFYYLEIKNPRCFDDIYRTLKHNAYDSSAEFATDVELIFSNAMAFNQDGTQIFNDAVTLRDYFRLLMSDLPRPYALPDYTKPTTKIRIRPVLATQTATPSSSRPAATKQESTPLTLKVPPAQPPAQGAASSQTSALAPAVNAFTLPVAPVTAQRPAPPARAPALKPSTPQVQSVKKSATPQPAATTQPVSFINANSSYYPRTQTPQVPVAAPAAVTPTVAQAPPVLRASSVLNTTQTRPQTPAPQVVYPLSRQLKSVNIQIQSNHRRLKLDRRDGVKTWSVRLIPGESSLLVNEVTYMEEEEEESSGDEHDEKDEEEDSMDVDHEVSPSKETRKKGKAKGRGRPLKTILSAKAQAAVAAKTAKTAKKKVSRKPEDIQLKLNNFIVSEQPEKPGEWNVCLVTGSNVIEIGEAGGMIWKLYAERIADT